MASLGHDPELERKLFCDDCRGGAHGQVISYDHSEIRSLLAADKLTLGERCVRCGVEVDSEGRVLSEEESERRRARHKPHAEERKAGAEFKEEDKSHRRA